MFCPSCGAEAAEGLSYCKRCGAKLGAARGGDDARPRVAGLVWAVSVAIALVTVGGFTAVFGSLIEVGAGAGSVMLALLGLLLLVVLVVDYLLARQLARLLSFHLHGGGGGPRGEKLDAAATPPARLEAPRSPAYGSLEQTTRTLGDLEQTTRTLEPAPREREDRV